MDLNPLIDKLDDLVRSAKKVRLSNEVRVDKREASAIVAQMRGAMPEELKEARWIAENRDEMLSEAKRETARILEEAREERAHLLSTEELARAAEQRAHRLLGNAHAREQEIRLGAEAYAGDILLKLDTYLTKLRDAVGRGRGRLGERGGDQVAARGGERVVEREAALVA